MRGAGPAFTKSEAAEPGTRAFALKDVRQQALDDPLLDKLWRKLGWGTDHDFRNVLEVGTSAMRNIHQCGDDFTEWLNLFCEQSADVATELEIHCDVDDGVDLYENCEGIPWDQKPLLDAL